MRETKTLTYTKGDHQHLVRYDVGEEAKVLDALITMVNRGDLDWFDVAVLSHQIGQNLVKEMKEKGWLP